jgi:hypothetical protein
MNEGVEKWTEARIQNALYEWLDLKKHRLIVPLAEWGSGISDLVSVDRHNLLFEFEIKLSRADFRADFRKTKHHYMKHREKFPPTVGGLLYIPSSFYFVTTKNLVRPSEVPSYAGLLYATPALDGHTYACDWFIQVRRAPVLHRVPLPEFQRRNIEQSLCRRYWRMRLNT